MDYAVGFIKMWEKSLTNFPEFERIYNSNEKRDREALLNQLALSMKQWEQELYFEKIDSSADDELFSKLRMFFNQALDYSNEQLDVIFSDEMIGTTCHFLKAARHYDPEISFHEIFQACRNVWIMNGLQYLFNVPVKLTPSIFAYSMLYPYTDNYIDDPTISAAEKYNFSLRFAKRLLGDQIKAQNNQERKIFRMVEIIEEEWDRSCYPGVYNSLLEIHKAQSQSTSLVLPTGSLNEDEIFRICINKGGASVVADGFLILGDLDAEQEAFLYAYGAYLQLLDDIQDTTEDLDEDLYTWHGTQAKQQGLNLALNQTWNAGQLVLGLVDRLNSSKVSVFKSLMKKSIDLFLIESVISNSQYFSKDYIREFEKYSPFRFSFIKKRSGGFLPFQDQFFENIERFTFSKYSEHVDFDFLKKEAC